MKFGKHYFSEQPWKIHEIIYAVQWYMYFKIWIICHVQKCQIMTSLYKHDKTIEPTLSETQDFIAYMSHVLTSDF